MSTANIPQSNYQLIINALASYADRTGIDLSKNPFAEKLQLSNSPDAILDLLHDREKAFKEYREGNRKLINRLAPAVEVLHAFSGVLGEAVSLVPFPPAKAIFVGIDALLAAASGVSSSYDALHDLFECIGSFLQRLSIYTKFPPTSDMTDVIVKIMAELLSVLALATKQIKEGRFKKFTKKLLGEKDVESVLQRLDRLTQDEAQMTVAQTLDIVYGLVGNVRVVMDDGKASLDNIRDALVTMHQIANEVNKMKREQMQSNVQHWLSPPDPSTNHGFVSNGILTRWKETGSLLWIHGKPGSGKSTLLSAVIQNVEPMCQAGLATMAYYYFDFREAVKQNRKGLLSSLLSQLCADSDTFCDILSRLRLSHASGARKPTDSALTKCLRDMLTLPRRGPIYIITLREEVLDLVQELVDWNIPNLYLCLTSRPEFDIRMVLEPITPLRISLHDEIGQKKDIIDYINAAILSDRKMKKWRKEDQQLVIDTLSEKADGMFRWVVCQIDRLRRSFPASIRSILNDLPKSLDETYEHMLRGIDDEKREYAQRLFRCLAVSIRPLRVEELADILAIKFDQGVSPVFDADWRPPDAEEAVFSACSSLISVVDVDGSQVVQFAHFSVKEFLTSSRLSTSDGRLSYYHIDTKASHIVVAHASLSLLLQLDDNITKDTISDLPFALYAAQHWVNHAQFEDVSSHIRDAMGRLFDSTQPHFSSWVWLCDIDNDLVEHMSGSKPTRPLAVPLYYASLCGFRDLVEHLAIIRPSDVTVIGGSHKTPLHAAIVKGHLEVVLLLLNHSANPNSKGRGDWTPLHLASRGGHLAIIGPLLENGANVETLAEKNETPLILASRHGHLEVTRSLLDNDANVNSRTDDNHTPLHFASKYGHIDVVQLLLDRRADIDAVNLFGRTALHDSSKAGHLDIVRLLVEHGADLNALDDSHETPFDRAKIKGWHEVAQFLLDRSALPGFNTKADCSSLHTASKNGHLDVVRSLLDHGEDVNSCTTSQETPLILASGNGKLEVSQFLLENDANVDARDKNGWRALHVASRKGHLNVVQLLLDHGADLNAQTADGRTPLDHASSKGVIEIVRLLIERGADLDSRAYDNWTPLHRASNRGHVDVAKLLLKHGADTDVESITGRTPLDVALLAGRFGVVQVLRAHWANTEFQDIEDWTMATAIRKGRSDIVESLLERGEDVNSDVSIADMGEVPALHHASFAGFLDIAQLLLKWGANVDLRDDDGWSALHWAARSCQLDIAILLLEHSANINARDNDHDTPLHVAALFRHLGAVQLLLKRGANPHLQSIAGETPSQIAALKGYHDIVRLLLGAPRT